MPRTLRVTFRFTANGPVGAVNPTWGYGVPRSSLVPTVDRAAFTRSLAGALAAQFGSGHTVSNVVFALGGSSPAVGERGSSGSAVVFDLVDAGNRYGDPPSVADLGGMALHVARALATAIGGDGSLLVSAVQARGGGGGISQGGRYRFDDLVATLLAPPAAPVDTRGPGASGASGAESGSISPVMIGLGLGAAAAAVLIAYATGALSGDAGAVVRKPSR
jgi:hypothetical protein